MGDAAKQRPAPDAAWRERVRAPMARLILEVMRRQLARDAANDGTAVEPSEGDR